MWTLSDISGFVANSAAQIRKQVQLWQAEHTKIFHSDVFEHICER